MKEFTYKIKSEIGIHMLPATKITSVAEKFKSKVTITKDGTTMNGKSVMGLISLCCRKDDEVTLRIEGEDEAAAYEALLDHFECNL
ncbi:MAG: HPr family phosphocarrier protein [Lachnospiraceae bacterium]|nr:HPr family phosphocarrier protein [Lachnospiraceae bacterium]